ncbi:MAG: sigma-70 family RNA polymerase sigma factor [Myxococcota bacterium]
MTVDLEAVARETWPQLRLGWDGFRARVGKLDEAARSSVRPADLLLAEACLAGDPLALKALDTQLLPKAASVLARMAPELREDALQAAREKLLLGDDGRSPRLAQYDGQGALVNWLRTVVYRVALNLQRGPQRVEDDEDMLAAMPDPGWTQDLQYLKAVHRREFGRAFVEALRTLEPLERRALRLHFADGLSIDRIGLLEGVHRATVARWIARAREQLSVAIQGLLRERLQVSEPELDELLASLQQNLGVSLMRLLREVQTRG